MFQNNLPFFSISFSFIMFIKRYLTVTRCAFGDLFLLGRHVEEVTFFNGGYILYERGTFWVKMATIG